MEVGQNWSLAMETVNIKLDDVYNDGYVYYMAVDKAIVNDVLDYFNSIEAYAGEKSVYGQGLKWEVTGGTDETIDLAIFDLDAFNEYKKEFTVGSDLGEVFTWLNIEGYVTEVLTEDEDELDNEEAEE